MIAEDLACQELVELVTDYLEGALAPCRRARFEQHLAACPFCVTYVEQIRQIIKTASAVAPQRLSPATQQRLLRAFRGWHSLEPPPPHESG